MDPAAVAARLTLLLDLAVEPGVPRSLGPVWLRVAAAAAPAREDRLAVIGPVASDGRHLARPGGNGEDAETSSATGGAALVAIGWATVDLDRAAAEAGASAGGAAVTGTPSAAAVAVDAPGDVSLGAVARVVRAGSGAPAVVLLEPSTEGRIAATLARVGEGPAALYVHPRAPTLAVEAARLRRAGVAVGSVVDGPLGPQLHVPGARPWGPHVIMVATTSPGEGRAPIDGERVPSEHE
jgi:hypothetical protein